MRTKLLEMQRTLSMRRLAAVTLIVFVLTLAFLAGRVRAGADPTQSATPASSTSQPQPNPTPSAPDTGSGSGYPPYLPSPYDDGSGGSAVPNDGSGGSAVPNDASPPVTHAS